MYPVAPIAHLDKFLHCRVSNVHVAFEILMHLKVFLTWHALYSSSASPNVFLSMLMVCTQFPVQDELTTSSIFEQGSLYLSLIDSTLGVIFLSA
jgi:hypothetical protein